MAEETNTQQAPTVKDISEVIIGYINPKSIVKFRVSTSGSGEIKSEGGFKSDGQQIVIRDGEYRGPIYDGIGTPILTGDGVLNYPARRGGKELLNIGGLESRAIDGCIEIIGEFESQVLSIMYENNNQERKASYLLGLTEGRKHDDFSHKFFERVGPYLLYTAPSDEKDLNAVFNFPEGKQFGPLFCSIEDVQLINNKVSFVGKNESRTQYKFVQGDKISNAYEFIMGVDWGSDANKEVYNVGEDVVFGVKKGKNWAVVINFEEVLEEYGITTAIKNGELFVEARINKNDGKRYIWHNNKKGPNYRGFVKDMSEIDMIDSKPLYEVTLELFGRIPIGKRIIHGNEIIKGFKSKTDYMNSLGQ